MSDLVRGGVHRCAFQRAQNGHRARSRGGRWINSQCGSGLTYSAVTSGKRRNAAVHRADTSGRWRPCRRSWTSSWRPRPPPIRPPSCARLADVEIPATYRGVVVRARGRSACSTASPAGTRTRASRCTCRTCRRRSSGPGEALIAVMASAINYNTVWTSIFEPVSTFKFLKKYAQALRARPRKHDLPYHVVGSDAAGVVLRVGAGRDQVAAGRPGGRALPQRRAGGRGRARRHDARPAAADLGLRDQLRRAGRAGDRQVQPADAEAGPPDLGRGGLARAWSTRPRTGSSSPTTARR